ncbi:hypothetical protein [Elizabethkingia meningoseptica]|uniref:hypothetical protein n=1 Tax=Elizabethkingia meningoseptica TaxID=238 RepID=UPI00162A853D|nr:hypothetical protein [Elizabethkingia meningoseptica]HAY3553765.1 hypothetical protein [Elizabethkingia meningoseptica]
MNPIVTFDFDKTLSRTDVQQYAKQLIKRNITVWVVTARYDELQKHRWVANPCNEDLYKVIEEVGIPRHQVRFQCMTLKSDYLKHTKVLWHLDDNEDELYNIKMNSDVNPIDVNFSTWKEECEALLEKYLKQNK